MVALSPLAGAGWQFFDNNGVPLSGGKLYTYAAGTTTPATTYTSSSGTTPHSNPIVLDGAGRIPGGEVWVSDNATYKFVLETALSILIGTYDNLSAANPGNMPLIPFGYTTATNVQAAFDDLGSNNGADFVGFLQPSPGAAARSVQAKLQDYVSVKDFGAVGDGVANDTAAIQAAIDSFTSGQGTVYFPKGTYLVTSTLTVSRDRMNLIGQGQWVSNILFQPTADDICIFIGKGGEGSTDAGVIVQCSVKGFRFASTNLTNKKTALELKDVAECYFEDIAIGATTQWLGNGSIGVRVRGREATTFSNMVVQTNRPFVFARNTSFPSICLDHFNFHNIFSACRGHFETVPVYNETNFFFEPGANFSNVSFTGYQAWLRGKNGLYYDNSVTAAAAASYSMNIQNVRWEGEPGDDDTGYAFYFNHGSTSYADAIHIQNAYIGEIGNGYYFRRCAGVTLQNNIWSRNSGEALNIDSSLGNEFLQIINCFWQTGATASIGTAFAAVNAVRSDNTAAVFKSAIYTAAQGLDRRDSIVGVPVNQGRIDVAAADPTVVTLPLDATATVVGVFADSRGKFAIVGFNVVAKTTTLIYDDGTWSITQGTAAKLNVYWDAGSSTWKVQNKTGVSRELYFQALGSNQ